MRTIKTEQVPLYQPAFFLNRQFPCRGRSFRAWPDDQKSGRGYRHCFFASSGANHDLTCCILNSDEARRRFEPKSIRVFAAVGERNRVKRVEHREWGSESYHAKISGLCKLIRFRPYPKSGARQGLTHPTLPTINHQKAACRAYHLNHPAPSYRHLRFSYAPPFWDWLL